MTKNQTRDAWIQMDAAGQILGRFATQVVTRLLSKDCIVPRRPQLFSPHIVVVNAAKINVTGRKEVQKRYTRHSGYPGGFREESFVRLRARKPEDIIRHAVSGMLPKNRFGRQLLHRLHIYAGEKHPHG